jgi:hypothetical protein
MLTALLLAATIQTAPPAADPRTAAPAPTAPPPACAAGTHRNEATGACVPDTVAVAPDQPATAVTGDTVPLPPAVDGSLQEAIRERPRRRNPINNLSPITL